MVTSKSILKVIIPTLLLIACANPSLDYEEESEALMQLSREWSELVASGDVDSFIDFWAEDAVMMPPGVPILEGKQAIREYVEAAMATPGFRISWEPLSAHISQGGDMAYMIERNVTEFDDADGNHMVHHGKVVTIWRKDLQGEWKNVVDTWNAAPEPGE